MAIRETLEEIRQRRVPERRHRSYPRVVKRKHIGAKLRKRDHHTGTSYDTPPDLHIFAKIA